MTPLEIFINAPEDPTPEALAAYLAQMCGEDAEKREQVEALFAASEAAGPDFLSTVNEVQQRKLLGIKAEAAPAVEVEGDRIGNYKLLQKIGEGGFGVVYMADQLEPVKRRVALKIIKLGMDTKEVVARFEAEKQALALMDHPNIAKVHDAGSTDSGRPFFVMEMVRGIPITDFCDGENLSTRERLGLFSDVCHAVQHAHQKGIIHRDLKPSNVMVTRNDDKAIVKVIDFGIAKATQMELTEKTLFTRFDQFIGTPAYMSPEQVHCSGLDIDTRSDIYALGVLLYELLTGRPPFNGKELLKAGYDEMRRVIREDEPPKPSTRLSSLLGSELTDLAKHRRAEPKKLRALVRGDLDWIVMKALDKDRRRRYEAATGLAQDIQRFLDDEPVLAAAPSLGYRVKKFARRHRSTLGVATAFGLTLIGATVFSSQQAIRATKAKDRATGAAIDLRVAGEETARHLTDSRHNEGEAWLAGARLMLEQKRFHSVRLMAGRALGFVPFDPAGQGDTFAGRYPPLLRKDSEQWAQAEQLATSERFDYPMLWATEAHRELVRQVTFSPDGSLLATASFDGTVVLWSVATGEKFRTLQHQSRVWDVAFSPDGSMLASGGETMIKLWDLSSRAPARQLRSDDDILALAFSPDGHRLASGGMNIRMWDVATGEEIGSFQRVEKITRDVAFSPYGDLLATVGFDEKLLLWDVGDGRDLNKPSRAFRRVPRPERLSVQRAVEFHPDGAFLTCAGDGGKLHFFTVPGLDKIAETPALHTSGVTALSFSPDGDLIASSGVDKALRIWGGASGQVRATLDGHHDEVEDVAFGPDASLLASCGLDNTVRLWDVGKVAAPLVNFPSTAIGSVQLAEHGAIFAVATGSKVALFASSTGERLSDVEFETDAHAIRLSPDGALLAAGCADHKIYLWDRRGSKLLHELDGHVADLTCLKFDPAGKHLASAGMDKQIIIWDTATAAPLSKTSHPDGVISIDFDTSGSLLAAGVQNGEIYVWDKSLGGSWSAPELAKTWQPYSNNAEELYVTFDPQRKRLATAGRPADRAGAIVHLWEADGAWAELGSFRQAERIHSLRFTPDGQRLAIGTDHGEIRIVEVAGSSPGKVTALAAHRHAVTELSVVAGADQLVSCSTDGTVRSWALDRGRWSGGDHLLEALKNIPDDRFQLASISFDWSERPRAEDPPHASPDNFAPLPDGPIARRNEAMFWRFSRAKNWGTAIAQLEAIPAGSNRYRAQRSLAMNLAEESRRLAGQGLLPLAERRLEQAIKVMPHAPHILRAEETLALLSNLNGDAAAERQQLERALQAARDQPPQADLQAYQRWGFSLARQLYHYHLRDENLDLEAARQTLEEIVSTYHEGMPIGCHTATLVGPMLEKRLGLAEDELADGNTAAAVAQLRALAAVEWYATIANGEIPDLRRIRPLLRLEQILAPAEPRRLVTFGSDWRYLASGKNPPSDWTGEGFDDNNWQQGPGMLGFRSEQQTMLPRSIGASDQSLKSYYFRHQFLLPADSIAGETDRLILRVKRDDGVVIYLNGKEVAADNMPQGDVTYDTLAIRDNGDEAADEIIEFELRADLLAEGENTIAAEVHQWATDSSDMHFDLELVASSRVTAGTYFAQLGVEALEQTLADALAMLPQTLAERWRLPMRAAFLNRGIPRAEPQPRNQN
ncbi:MAG: protein kinase domain-containing protein [Verrucomicrobiales bacterium]